LCLRGVVMAVVKGNSTRFIVFLWTKRMETKFMPPIGITIEFNFLSQMGNLSESGPGLICQMLLGKAQMETFTWRNLIIG
jgi:hypothetical protein